MFSSINLRSKLSITLSSNSVESAHEKEVNNATNEKK